MPQIPPLPERVARYERLVVMRDDKRMSMQQMADAETKTSGKEITRQQVWNILAAGPPRRAGRPGQTRREELVERIHRWADRAAAQREAGRDDSTAQARARESRRALAELDLEGASPSRRRDMPYGHVAEYPIHTDDAEPECRVCRVPLKRVQRPSGGTHWVHGEKL